MTLEPVKIARQNCVGSLQSRRRIQHTLSILIKNYAIWEKLLEKINLFLNGSFSLGHQMSNLFECTQTVHLTVKTVKYNKYVFEVFPS